ncbi:hypothetical protein MNBD_GAMMA10-1726 [hydrothermal vent metagenome]|uniref:WG repeat-containing protein n=1 Tax=hydrothermal vent metagenome TaxID=652676 RepID=A0A3B0YB48_9ZZZZ
MNLYRIKSKKGHGFINDNGDIIIKPQFQSVGKFSEGLAWAVAEINGNACSGFIDESGEWAIAPEFSSFQLTMWSATQFSEGLAPIHVANNKMCFIDKKGNRLTDLIYDDAYPFSEGRALVRRDKLWGYIDVAGNEVIACQYGEANMSPQENRFSEGLALVRFGDNPGFDDAANLGYIDREGGIVLPGQFTAANAFSEGIAMVRDEASLGKYAFIRLDGSVAFEQESSVSARFSEGLAEYYDSDSELLGYINQQPEWVIDAQFMESSCFSEGLAGVKPETSRNWGFINTQGEMVIPAHFKTVMAFENGLSQVEHKDGHYGYINKTGEFVWRNK